MFLAWWRVASNGNGEGEVVFCGQGRFGNCHCLPRARPFDRFAKGKLGLRGVRRGLASPHAISFQTMPQFATPGRVVADFRCAPGPFAARLWTRISLGTGRGAFFKRRKFRGKNRITKMASSYARCQYGATLRACFCHRCVLRCGRFHSGEEGTMPSIPRRQKVKERSERLCCESASGTRHQMGGRKRRGDARPRSVARA